MRRVINGLAVLFLAVSLTTTSLYAAPRRDRGDDTYSSPIKRLVQLVKRVVRGLDTIDMTYPKP